MGRVLHPRRVSLQCCYRIPRKFPYTSQLLEDRPSQHIRKYDNGNKRLLAVWQPPNKPARASDCYSFEQAHDEFSPYWLDIWKCPEPSVFFQGSGVDRTLCSGISEVNWRELREKFIDKKQAEHSATADDSSTGNKENESRRRLRKGKRDKRRQRRPSEMPDNGVSDMTSNDAVAVTSNNEEAVSDHGMDIEEKGTEAPVEGFSAQYAGGSRPSLLLPSLLSKAIPKHRLRQRDVLAKKEEPEHSSDSTNNITAQVGGLDLGSLQISPDPAGETLKPEMDLGLDLDLGFGLGGSTGDSNLGYIGNSISEITDFLEKDTDILAGAGGWRMAGMDLGDLAGSGSEKATESRPNPKWKGCW